MRVRAAASSSCRLSVVIYRIRSDIHDSIPSHLPDRASDVLIHDVLVDSLSFLFFFSRTEPVSLIIPYSCYHIFLLSSVTSNRDSHHYFSVCDVIGILGKRSFCLNRLALPVMILGAGGYLVYTVEKVRSKLAGIDCVQAILANNNDTIARPEQQPQPNYLTVNDEHSFIRTGQTLTACHWSNLNITSQFNNNNKTDLTKTRKGLDWTGLDDPEYRTTYLTTSTKNDGAIKVIIDRVVCNKTVVFTACSSWSKSLPATTAHGG